MTWSSFAPSGQTPDDALEPKSDIIGFFGGRSVFVTGGSGYLGRVLLFKLLACCPDIGKVCAHLSRFGVPMYYLVLAGIQMYVPLFLIGIS